MKYFYGFLLANAVTFGFLALLQFLPFPWFFLGLVCMHGGVALFFWSKRGFLREGFPVKPVYALEYALLALCLPILGWKLLGALGLVTVVEHIKAFLVLGLTALCLVISLGNSLRLYAIVKR